MTQQSSTLDSSVPATGVVIELRTLLWAAAVGLFVALRIGPTWQAGVAGAELVHLSGAWQASIGEAGDSRFVSSLFQAISAFMLKGNESEVPIRVLAVVASLGIPFALYRLRASIGEPAALFALVFIAIDPIGILYTTGATAMALDVPVALGLLVLVTRDHKLSPALLAVAGFALGVTGPIVLTLGLAILVTKLLKREAFDKNAVASIAAGAFVGMVLSLANWGLGGFGGGIAPINILAGSFDERWSTPTSLQVLGMYSWPLAAGGLFYAAVIARRAMNGSPPPPILLLCAAWAAIGLAWLVASAAAHSPAPVLGLTLPCSILAAAGLVELIGMLRSESWQAARFVAPAGIVAGLIAITRGIRWARLDNLGTTSQRIQVIVLVFVVIGAVLWLLRRGESRPVLGIIAAAVGGLLVLSGTFGVGLSGSSELVLSPLSTVQARQLHDRAVSEGVTRVAVHPRFEDDVTWPFRGIDEIVVTTQPQLTDGLVVWPADQAGPDGFSPIEGTWRLISEVTPPTRDGLTFIKWLSDRNNIAITGTTIAVYRGAEE